MTRAQGYYSTVVVSVIQYRVTVTPIEIKLTGTRPVTNAPSGAALDQALIGQVVTATVSGATPVQWTLPTEAFKSYVVASGGANAELNRVPATDITGKTSVSFSSVLVSSTEVEIKCDVTALGQPLTLTKKLALKVPDSSLFTRSYAEDAEVAEVSVNEYPAGTKAPSGQLLTGLWLRTQGTATAPAAVYFGTTVATPSAFTGQGPGKFQLVQLINEQRYKTADTGDAVPSAGTTNTFNLDQQYPYAPSAPTVWNANIAVGSTPKQDQDTPGTKATDDDKHIEVRNEEFRMYLMYQPPGGGSQWVPLRVLYWGWQADALRPDGGWMNWVPGTPAGSIIGGWDDGDTTATHPIWSKINL